MARCNNEDKTLMLQPRPARVTPSALPAPPGVSTSGDGGGTEVGAERPQRLPPTSSSSVLTVEQRNCENFATFTIPDIANLAKNESGD